MRLPPLMCRLHMWSSLENSGRRQIAAASDFTKAECLSCRFLSWFTCSVTAVRSLSHNIQMRLRTRLWKSGKCKSRSLYGPTGNTNRSVAVFAFILMPKLHADPTQTPNCWIWIFPRLRRNGADGDGAGAATLLEKLSNSNSLTSAGKRWRAEKRVFLRLSFCLHMRPGCIPDISKPPSHVNEISAVCLKFELQKHVKLADPSLKSRSFCQVLVRSKAKNLWGLKRWQKLSHLWLWIKSEEACC